MVIRVAFTLFSSKDETGTGNYNYIVNLVQALAFHACDEVQPVLFVGKDMAPANIAPFEAIPGLQIICAREFDDTRRGWQLLQTLTIGSDLATVKQFRQHRIDLAFENAKFYGWRFALPVVAWMPDFQHRKLKHLFSLRGFWKRECGFRAQVLCGRQIMLSSEDSRRDCESFYPRSVGRTSVVRFAVAQTSLRPFDFEQTVVEKYYLPPNFFYLPNQFWKHKNHQIVIEALHLLKERGNNLVVATSGKSEDHRHMHHYRELHALVESYGLGDNFRFLGMVPSGHVIALMRSCTALINPSLCEGWSTSVEEAKSLGVPMLLSNIDVHIEQAGGFAKFFDPRFPGELSALMEQSHPMGASERENVEHQAGMDSRKRIESFAFEFSDMVRRCVNSFKHPERGQEH